MKKAQTKSKLPLLVIALGLILVGALIVLPKFFPKSSPPDASGLKTYQNTKFGFSLKHPLGWSVNDSNFAQNQEIIVFEDSQNAFVKINAYQDPNINSEAAVRNAMERFKQEMEADPNVTISQSQADFNNQVGGHIIIGQQVIDGQNYQFQNRGLFSTDGRLLLFHGVVKQDVANQEYKDAINTIIDNFSLE